MSIQHDPERSIIAARFVVGPHQQCSNPIWAGVVAVANCSPCVLRVTVERFPPSSPEPDFLDYSG